MQSKQPGIWRRFRAAFVVVVITLLIWFAADQNVTIGQSFDIPIRLSVTDKDRYAGFAESPFQRVLTVTMRGRRRRLQEFGDLINSRPVFVLNVNSSKPIGSEPQSLSVVDDILLEMPEILESRLSIESVDPATLRVRIDDYVSVEDVRVDPDFGDLQVSADYAPKRISVRAPRFVAALLGTGPVATATVEQHVRNGAGADGRFKVTVPLTFRVLKDLDPNLRIYFPPPGDVTITGRIEALTETLSKGPVQITWSIPDAVQKDYVVIAQQASFRVNIDVTGPKDQVAQLDPADILGVVEVFAGDVDDPGPGKEITRDAKFFLTNSPAFPDCSLVSESQPIRFRLEARPGSPVANNQG